MKKRIAYLGLKGVPYSGGAERVVEAILHNLDQEKYHATVYCNNQLIPVDASFPGVNLVHVRTLPGKHLSATSHFLFSAIHTLLHKNYDLIHLHNVEASFMLPLLRLRYKVVSTSHGQAQGVQKWGQLARKLIQLTEYTFAYLSNKLTSVSQPLTHYYQSQYHKEVNYIPNGVDSQIDIDEAKAEKILAPYGLEPGKYILFAAGRIIPIKGCDILLDAFDKLDSDIKLLVVGNADQVPEYKTRLQALANDRVCFCSFIADKATLMGLISQAHLFVFPSLFEAMSMMLLEVASVGTPLIVSDIPQNSAVLPDQALFFKSGNSSDLFTKLSWALANPDEMLGLAQQARAWVNANYDWSHIIAMYEQVYESTLVE